MPPGNVFLLKSLLISTGASTNTSIQVWVLASDNGTVVYWEARTPAAGSPANIQTWIALNAGDQVGLVTGNAAVNYWLSGAVLPFVPGL